MNQSPNSPPVAVMKHRSPSAAFVILLILAVTARDAVGATIFVTTPQQKISSSGGCSLQEAIYSANLHSNLAIDATDPDDFSTTQCVAGTGNDTIVLPTGGMFQLSSFLDGDAYNPYGPTATPIIFSNITIEGHGATLQWTGTGNARLFAVGPASIKTPNGTASGTGNLTLRNVYVKGFHVKGGDGGSGGGGGGLGAGGAIYVQNGNLTVENSTFDGNAAVGGNGDAGSMYGAGGGGGLGGNGGSGTSSGGGGGGARGDGGIGGVVSGDLVDGGGGGGGTVFTGGGFNNDIGGPGGYLCGGNGGDASTFGNDGHDGKCPGGGGGGGGGASELLGPTRHGGNGNYGGGGGGGATSGLGESGDGGNGGFGGGGGAAAGDGVGGNGGFGGGGGAGGHSAGSGGPFGGHAGSTTGGAGAAVGGAIFNDNGDVTIRNSTFTNNVVVQGNGANNEGAPRGAIFSRNGSLTIVDSTISGNQSPGIGAGVVVFSDSTAVFNLNDTIIANNGANECFFSGNVTAAGAGNLIMSNGGLFGDCPGVVTSVDPQLGPLQDNGGPTKTMAIPLFSSAMSAADSGTSLPYDQRYADRPQGGGWDIGAFQVCRRKIFQMIMAAPCGETNVLPPSTTTLIMNAIPSVGGTTDPAPGSHTVDLNSVIPITVTTNPGWFFIKWTGPVGDPSNPSTTVAMYQSQDITANFDTTPPPATPTPTPTPSRTATATPSATRTATVTPTRTSTPTVTVTNSPTLTATTTSTNTATRTLTATATPSPSPSATATPTPTVTPTSTPTATSSPTVTLTATPTNSATPTLTPPPTPSPTVTSVPVHIPCAGDCNGNSSVTVDELLTLVNIALGNADVSTCDAGDVNRDQQVTIDEILTAVDAALGGCPMA